MFYQGMKVNRGRTTNQRAGRSTGLRVKGARLLVVIGLSIALISTASGGPGDARADTSSTDANITRVATSLLEHSQFAHHPLDGQLAGTFLDRYLDALDGGRSVFLQSDVDEFGAYRPTLARDTRDQGDTSAARAIFARYLLRLGQRVTYVTELLARSKFEFSGHDVYSFDREHAARPRDPAAARDLWRQEVRAEYLQEKLADKQPGQIVETLTHHYAQQLATMKALRGDEVLEIYLNALAHVYDPHSDYLGHEQMDSFSIAMNLSLFGIGASLETEDGYCKIRDLLPGGPAARSALLKPGDKIIAVAQGGKEPVDIMNMPLSRAVELIRGPKGTAVTLTVIPVGDADGAVPRMVPLVRDQIKLEDQAAKARILDLPTDKGAGIRMGVIDLPSFYVDVDGHAVGGHRSATADVARLLTKLKAEHVRGVVLDLRRNGGGSLEEAISLTGLFIRKGPVVQTRGPAGDIEVEADTDASVLYDGPLIVLTSRFSASASEILAGALQDYGRAVIVGDSSTFGKGTVQNVVPLARFMDQAGLDHAYDPGALKVTIRKFYRPSGTSTQLRGVAADIVLPSTSDFSDVSEGALKDPLPWDAVPSAPHERLNRVQPYIGALKEGSVRRIGAARAFAYMADDIARLKKSLATKSVSLNEEERRHELAESKARESERQLATRASSSTDPVTYEITLKNASLPGLPPPGSFSHNAKTARVRGGSSSTGEPEGDPTGRSRADDVILKESVQILADYAGLMSGQSTWTNLGTRGSVREQGGRRAAN